MLNRDVAYSDEATNAPRTLRMKMRTWRAFLLRGKNDRARRDNGGHAGAGSGRKTREERRDVGRTFGHCGAETRTPRG